jgi:hypothetical protein
MRLNSAQLIKSSATQPDPAAETESTGMPADAHGLCKNHATATLRYRSGQALTATNQTAGTLCLRFRAQYRDSQRTKARVWQLAIAIATTAARHILFLLDLDYYMTMIS